jgi:hypothetical protein
MTLHQRWKQTTLPNTLSALGTVALVAVGVAQVVIYCRQTKIMSTQAQIANSQLAEMQLEGRAQRPWIPVPSVWASEPLTFDANGDASITFGRSIKNIGHSPTANVSEQFHAEVLTKDTVFDAVTAEAQACTDARKNAATDQFRGKFLFPNDSDTESAGAGVGHETYKNAWPSANDVVFRIVGCIDYTFADDPKTHGQTGFSFELSRPIDGGAHRAGFDPAYGPYPVNEMVLEPDFFHAGYIQ